MHKLIDDFSFGLFFWEIILFLALLLLLRKFAWKPILNAVNEREESIESALNEAKKAREEMSQLKAENEQILKEAKIERDAILKDAREAREAMIAQAKETAQASADKLIADAKKAIDNEKQAAMTDLRNQVAQLSIDVAETVLRRELNDKPAQEALAKQMVNEAKLS